MLKLISDASKRLSFLLRESQETKAQIAGVREKLRQVTTKVETMTVELEHERENSRRDWEKIEVLMQRLQKAVDAHLSENESQIQNGPKDSE